MKFSGSPAQLFKAVQDGSERFRCIGHMGIPKLAGPVAAASGLVAIGAGVAVQPHERVKEWVQSNRDAFQHKAISDLGFLRLAQKFCGAWPAESALTDPFQKCVAAFLDGVALATTRSHAVVVQSSLVDTFARGIRRQVRELGLDRPAVAAPAISMA